MEHQNQQQRSSEPSQSPRGNLSDFIRDELERFQQRTEFMSQGLREQLREQVQPSVPAKLPSSSHQIESAPVSSPSETWQSYPATTTRKTAFYAEHQSYEGGSRQSGYRLEEQQRGAPNYAASDHSWSSSGSHGGDSGNTKRYVSQPSSEPSGSPLRPSAIHKRKFSEDHHDGHRKRLEDRLRGAEDSKGNFAAGRGKGDILKFFAFLAPIFAMAVPMATIQNNPPLMMAFTGVAFFFGLLVSIMVWRLAEVTDSMRWTQHQVIFLRSKIEELEEADNRS